LRELAKLSLKNNKLTFTTTLEKNLPVNNQTLQDLQEKIWYVVKSNNTNESYASNFTYELKKNDIIKLGRIKFWVKDMNICDGEFTTTYETFRPFMDIENTNITSESICRICLYSSTDEINPMISLCKCKGTMDTMHLNCLQKWLQHKSTTKEIAGKPGVSYVTKSFNCEICKEPYPTSIKYNGVTYGLMNYEVPDNQNYIILESLNSIKENQYPLSVHVMMFIENESSFLLGRGHESDVRISGISVSRTHARVYMKNNKFMLEDKGSKFGTLVLSKEAVNIENLNGNQQILQIGRTLINVTETKGNLSDNSKQLLIADAEENDLNMLSNQLNNNIFYQEEDIGKNLFHDDDQKDA